MSLSDKPTYVYWIRHINHTDILSQGYVGITSNTPEKRFKQHIQYHLRQKIKSNFNNAINKYHPEDSLILETICLTSKEHALFIENKLRPDDLIGWNICKGGQIGLPKLTDAQVQLGRKRSKENTPRRKGEQHPCYGIPFSDERKQALSLKIKMFYENNPEARKRQSESSKGRLHTVESRAKMSSIAKSLAKDRPPWNASASDKNMWLQADIIYETYILLNCCGNFKLKNFLNVPIQKTKIMHKLFREGWVPVEDERWIKFYEQNKAEGYPTIEELAVLSRQS